MITMITTATAIAYIVDIGKPPGEEAAVRETTSETDPEKQEL